MFSHSRLNFGLFPQCGLLLNFRVVSEGFGALGAVPKGSRLDFLPSSTCLKKAKENLINLSEKLYGLKSFVPNARKVEVLFFLSSYKW